MKRDIGLFILRLLIGGMMLLSHGWPKLAKFTTMSSQFPDPIGLGSTFSLTLAVFAEFFCSIALIAGILTRWVAVPLLITMLVAVIVIHAEDPFSVKEKALLYAIPFLSLIFTGPGKISLDSLLGRD